MSQKRIDLALLLLRAAIGVVFVAHGLQKFFVFGHAGLTAFFESVGIPFASMHAIVVPALEVTGGLALLAGLATRVTGVVFASVMAVAFLTVHVHNGFYMETNGFEFVFTLFFANVTLALLGAGHWSVDATLTGTRTVPRVAARMASRKAA
jgi:putative oxidoreductase